MLVRVEGKILSVKQNNGKSSVVISQINSKGFQELMKIYVSAKANYEVGEDIAVNVNVRAAVTKDGRAIIVGYEV